MPTERRTSIISWGTKELTPQLPGYQVTVNGRLSLFSCPIFPLSRRKGVFVVMTSPVLDKRYCMDNSLLIALQMLSRNTSGLQRAS